MIISTTDTIPGREIADIPGVCRGNVVRAKHLGKDIMAGLKGMVGGEITEYTELMTEARDQAFNRMVKEAEEKGADAVVNVRFVTGMIAQPIIRSIRMKQIGRALIALSILMAGCGGTKKREANAEEYFKNLRIHVQPTSRTAMNGILEPKFTLVVTNAGGRTIRQMKIVGEVSLGNAYHDTIVKMSREKIKQDGGQIKLDFAFAKSPKMPDAHVLMNQLKYNFTVQEIGF